ncbi:hypothetical protein HD554DRAFT_1525678 [Boletus coccyginus]|nr:hypothetical protein HD554DRAFT_1525678 [Boletus coccyginus]
MFGAALALVLCTHFCLLSADASGIRLSKDLSLSVSFGDPVAIRVDKTAHYSLESDEGKAEFDALIPHGGHTVVLPDPRNGKPVTYTVTLLHQLKCLGIIRDNYNSREPPSQLTKHCMNYLRQSTLCNINTRIEHSVKPKGNAVRGYDAVCRDWTKLYDEVERIQFGVA